MGLKDNKQVGKNHHFYQSLFHALNGLRVLLVSERNFRAHSVSALAVLLGAFLLRASLNDYLWLVLSIFIVLFAETINSIVERVVDMLVGDRYSELAKEAKDIAAGGVLLTAFLASVIGLIVFVPLLLKLMPWR
ncbi:diacylglycerol kinase family protein [Lactobacillus sp. Sy-1]|uniref:diacylglycerol kinase family protein n=1 Tax=Lactobacillus sp. Sy-1 TaxID=2109645 RepID=UPI001C58E7DA|nr:diacylglycerol kinase family protein [Lactobacillus sp. Sy-1]MBW1605523.1 diacylglycerol kinase family protein [Lactobacillus sp. Sy-1]